MSDTGGSLLRYLRPGATGTPRSCYALAVLAAALLVLTPLFHAPPIAASDPALDLCDRIRYESHAHEHVRMGLVVVDLETTEHCEINGNRIFRSASLYKNPLLAELMRQVEAGEHALDDRLVLEPRHSEDDPPAVRLLEPFETTVGEAAELMVARSNNPAAVALQELLGEDEVDAAPAWLGMPRTIIEPMFMSTPLDQAHFLVSLYYREIVSERASEQMLEWLYRQEVQDLIRRSVPPEVPIAHKTGMLDHHLHDAGIISAPAGDVVLVAMTHHTGEQQDAMEAIQSLAALVYQAFSHQRADDDASLLFAPADVTLPPPGEVPLPPLPEAPAEPHPVPSPVEVRGDRMPELLGRDAELTPGSPSDPSIRELTPLPGATNSDPAGDETSPGAADEGGGARLSPTTERWLTALGVVTMLVLLVPATAWSLRRGRDEDAEIAEYRVAREATDEPEPARITLPPPATPEPPEAAEDAEPVIDAPPAPPPPVTVDETPAIEPAPVAESAPAAEPGAPLPVTSIERIEQVISALRARPGLPPGLAEAIERELDPLRALLADQTRALQQLATRSGAAPHDPFPAERPDLSTAEPGPGGSAGPHEWQQRTWRWFATEESQVLEGLFQRFDACLHSYAAGPGAQDQTIADLEGLLDLLRSRPWRSVHQYLAQRVAAIDEAATDGISRPVALGNRLQRIPRQLGVAATSPVALDVHERTGATDAGLLGSATRS